MTLISNDKPAYRILAVSGFYGPDDTLYPEGSEIYYEGEPNEEMEPLNEPARVKLVEYLEKLDVLARQVSEKTGKTYIGRPRTLDGALAWAREIERAAVPVMGHLGQKDSPSISKVHTDETPEVGSANPKRGRGRPKTSLAVA